MRWVEYDLQKQIQEIEIINELEMDDFVDIMLGLQNKWRRRKIMGLFDKFKKTKEGVTEKQASQQMKEEKREIKQDEDVCTIGWDAITNAFEKLYPLGELQHFGSLIKWRFGGDNPLDGVSVYEAEDYYHFVTFGLSELYEKETDDPEWSGYGMEFTMKLKKDCINAADDEEREKEFRCVCSVFSMVAKLTFTNGELFLPNEYIYTKQTTGIDVHQTSALTGFILVSDTSIPQIDTDNGKVEFVEFVGCTDDELVALYEKRMTVEELYSKLGTDVTDYRRTSAI